MEKDCPCHASWQKKKKKGSIVKVSSLICLLWLKENTEHYPSTGRRGERGT